MPTPLKRHKSLQPISREHHHGLLLAWKIREGFKNEIEPIRMKKYVNWFWNHHLQSHFEFEEKYIFPILGENNSMVIQAMKEHHQLKQLIHENDDIVTKLSQLETLIVSHIRFEERILFNKIQGIASDEQLKYIQENHDAIAVEEEWKDEFWSRSSS